MPKFCFFPRKTEFFIKIENLLLIVYVRKKRNPSQKKKFRINAKKLFLTYPKKCTKTKVELDKNAVFRALGVKLQDVMYNLDISSRELSEVLNKTSSAIVKLTRQRTMPRINSAYLSSLLIALNQIRERKLADNIVETYDIKRFSQKILLTDLIEFFDPSFWNN